MNKPSKIIATSLLALMTVAALAAPALTFTGVIDNLDLRHNTKLHIKEYWKAIQHQPVSWSGEAYDVKGGRSSRVKILVADKSRPLYKGYNIVVITTDIEKAANIKKGQVIKFSGTLNDYSPQHAGAVMEVVGASLE